MQDANLSCYNQLSPTPLPISFPWLHQGTHWQLYPSLGTRRFSHDGVYVVFTHRVNNFPFQSTVRFHRQLAPDLRRHFHTPMPSAARNINVHHLAATTITTTLATCLRDWELLKGLKVAYGSGGC